MATNVTPFGERRLYERKECLRLVGIYDDSILYSAHLRDLGMGGAFLEPKEGNSSEVGQELLLAIPYALKNGFVELQAEVAWVKHLGIGVRFIKRRESKSP